MTGNEFIALRSKNFNEIRELQAEIEKARQEVKIPEKQFLRAATSKDIIEGAIIYHIDETNQYWNLIGYTLNPNHDFKAYVAEDGARYGLHNAFVET